MTTSADDKAKRMAAASVSEQLDQLERDLAELRRSQEAALSAIARHRTRLRQMKAATDRPRRRTNPPR